MLSRKVLGTLLTISIIFTPLQPVTAQEKSDEKKVTGEGQNKTDPCKDKKDKNKKKCVDEIGNRDVGKGINLYSLESEVALGKALAQQVEKTAKLVDDPRVVEFVNRVGQNLVRNSDSRVPFTIKVIDSDELNAFALPGGFFYVNSGVILRADEEAELAGVMAHEIAHVTARHGTRNATKGQMVEWAMIPLMIFLPGGWAGYGIYQGLSYGLPLTFLSFSRAAEREADFLGLQYMYKAGYDPNAYVAFFEKVQAEEKKKPGSIPKVFSSHPPTPERIQNTQNEIANVLPARDAYITTTSEFDEIKARLQTLKAGRTVKDKDPNEPTLRKKTEQDKDKNKECKDGKDCKSDPADPDEDRPTLKKRP